ncbi:hypothetical protein NW752_008225 [Fusarium irregulare]|nr:hypothetical protein NW752_008225 [Fusarium irregulare]
MAPTVIVGLILGCALLGSYTSMFTSHQHGFFDAIRVCNAGEKACVLDMSDSVSRRITGFEEVDTMINLLLEFFSQGLRKSPYAEGMDLEALVAFVRAEIWEQRNDTKLDGHFWHSVPSSYNHYHRTRLPYSPTPTLPFESAPSALTRRSGRSQLPARCDDYILCPSDYWALPAAGTRYLERGKVHRGRAMAAFSAISISAAEFVAIVHTW